MSFVAAIDSSKNISVWSRAVNALAQVLDQIKFTITATGLTLLAVNPSRTSHGDISFQKHFFREFLFDTANIMVSGFRAGELDPNALSYSCIVSTKHMVVLFKNLDAGGLSYICLRFDCHQNVPRNKEFRILVEILTRKMIVKKYLMNYQPVLPQEVLIPRLYKKDYDLGRCKHLKMETGTMKSFLDIVPVSTEDFMIDVKLTKILFVAHTKQVVKDRELLKQPMLITILMSIDELMELNLDGVTASINFRLKDFRTFITCCASMRDMAHYDDDLLPEALFEAYFKGNGNPVVLEHTSGPVTATLVLITASAGEPLENDDNRDKYVLHGHAIQRAPEREIPEPVRHKNASASGRLTNIGIPPRREPSIEPDSNHSFQTSSMGDIVTYGKRGSTPVEIPHKRAKVLDGDTDYSTSGEDDGGEQVFGPTQHNNKPTSLFE